MILTRFLLHALTTFAVIGSINAQTGTGSGTSDTTQLPTLNSEMQWIWAGQAQDNTMRAFRYKLHQGDIRKHQYTTGGGSVQYYITHTGRQNILTGLREGRRLKAFEVEIKANQGRRGSPLVTLGYEEVSDKEKVTAVVMWFAANASSKFAYTEVSQRLLSLRCPIK
ncbi:hypothetical protein BDP27DRAFT_1359017 [Rhodocollybia butyracea]|uniref:Uncharacterized protein n=1 Tax=Rhodocollybia butyracea TaxID=206335 RepID=A0A9P5Q5V1_9AGAR|nr:hypothetical protein BDP27DRAFT_1359017 [Rhodocollybia butyracea]